MSEHVAERCPICNSDTRRDEPEYGKGAHSFSCGTVFRSNGDVAFRWGDCVERAEKWLRRQLAQAQAEVERLRREREMLAEAVMAMKYFFDSDYSDPEESAALNWSYAHQKWLEAIALLDDEEGGDREWPTRESERARLMAGVGECCFGADPMCAAGCLVEAALKRRLVDKEGTA